MADETVTVYTERDYQGKSQALKPGAYDASELKEGEDAISSVRVPEGWTVSLYEDPNFGGRAKLLTSSTEYVGDDFDNVTSSLIVADPQATKGMNVAPRSMAKLANGFPPKFEQVMVLSFTMTIDQP
ncbi:peptidase inhibitor family I36 protein [Streptomyces sp. NPDC059970]|uniref:peptidase inhibitor family I36 protein n=1 Tax=Streptomyces sp. NPDC059970 TaxID=3347019 RepID=UPI0036AA79A1